MDWREGIFEIDRRVALARAAAPDEPVTRAARVATTAAITVFGLIFLPVQLVTTALGGCLIALTLGLFVIVLTLIWLPLYALVIGTSWLWIRAWYLRPLLFAPGVVLAVVANLFVALAPEPERDAKYAKLSITGEWPLSWYIVHPPGEAFGLDESG